MEPIIYGETQKKSYKKIIVLSAFLIITALLTFIVGFSLLDSTSNNSSTTIIITGNKNSAVFHSGNIKSFIFICFGSFELVFGIYLLSVMQKHKADKIFIYENNIKIISGKDEQELSFKDILECKLSNKLTIKITNKYSQKKYFLFGVSNAEKIIETINKNI